MKKGKSSLYLQGRSSISSLNPSITVPNTITITARCCSSCWVSPLRKMDSAMPIMMKATAAERPTHSGIYFSPPLLPFLFMSMPNIRFFSMKWLILGIRMLVAIQLHPPPRRIGRLTFGSIWTRMGKVPRAATPRVSLNWLIHVLTIIKYTVVLYEHSGWLL